MSGVVKIGFTGTRTGMTPPQLATVTRLVKQLQPTEVHHGDCVGADAQFHELVRELLPATKIVVHPPDKNALRAHCVADEICSPAPYLARNRSIVDVATDGLIGTPQGFAEEKRSGTWFTMRYARKVGRKIWIVDPGGDLMAG